MMRSRSRWNGVRVALSALVEKAAAALRRVAGLGRARPVAEADVAQFSFADHGTAAG